MAAIRENSERAGRGGSWKWAIGLPLGLTAAAGLGIWWFTAPLEDTSVDDTPVPAVAVAPPTEIPRPVWPEGKVEGDEAKRLLLDVLEYAFRRIERIEDYTATFKKQERVGGKLLPEQTLAMKVRQHPFAIYFKFLAPKAGKEVVYAEGHRGNKVIAHNGDWTRRLVPRLSFDPTSDLALAENRHPITDAGLENLTRKLIGFRKLDLKDPEAVTVLNRVTDTDGKPRLRSVHLHPHQNPERPFARVEVLYDPETYFPVQITSYDWPKPGETGPLELAERYRYENLVLDPRLTALDFDPANPSYEFMRY